MRKIISVVLSFGLLFQQSGMLYAAGEINLANYLSQAKSAIVQPDQFRPAQLRYISYDIKSNDFKLLLDKGGAKLNELSNSLNSSTPKLNNATQELFNYFLIGLSLPNDTFWVNLRPDAPENIIDPLLEKTDIGKIFLEADLQLKKDTASLTSPQNPEGKAYWDKLYKKAGELFGTENITIPTITRPWIVPNEVIVRETEDSAYIYKATLKVMLEADYLQNQKTEKPKNGKTEEYSFSDPRLKELNEYSSQIIRETIVPKLTKEVNSGKRYAKLRQVYYSLVLARWFKQKYSSLGSIGASANSYLGLIDSRNLVNLVSQEPCDKQAYFQAYQKSFKDGEYNLKETVSTPFGQSIRSYISGGIVASPIIFWGTKKEGDNLAVTKTLTGPPPATTASPLTAEEEKLINEIITATSEGEFKGVSEEILYRIGTIIKEITDVEVEIRAEDLDKSIMDLRGLEKLDSLYWLEFIALLEKYSGVELLEDREDIEIKLGESVNKIVEDLRGRMSKENGGDFKGLLKLICRIEVDDLLKKVPMGAPKDKISEIKESINKDKIGDAAFKLGQIFLNPKDYNNADVCNLIWKAWPSVTAGSPLTDAEARYILERDTRNIENIIYFSTLQYTDKEVLLNYLSNPVQSDIMSAVYKADNIRLSNKNIEWLSDINVEHSFEADILLSKRDVIVELGADFYSAIPEISEMSKHIPSLLDHKDIGDFLCEVINTLNNMSKNNSLEAFQDSSAYDVHDSKLRELRIRMYRKELARIIYSGVVRFSAQTFQAVENTLINDFVSQAVVDIKNAVKDAVAGNIESSREINIALQSDLLFARLSDMEKKLSDPSDAAGSPVVIKEILLKIAEAKNGLLTSINKDAEAIRLWNAWAEAVFEILDKSNGGNFKYNLVAAKGALETIRDKYQQYINNNNGYISERLGHGATKGFNKRSGGILSAFDDMLNKLKKIEDSLSVSKISASPLEFDRVVNDINKIGWDVMDKVISFNDPWRHTFEMQFSSKSEEQKTASLKGIYEKDKVKFQTIARDYYRQLTIIILQSLEEKELARVESIFRENISKYPSLKIGFENAVNKTEFIKQMLNNISVALLMNNDVDDSKLLLLGDMAYSYIHNSESEETFSAGLPLMTKEEFLSKIETIQEKVLGKFKKHIGEYFYEGTVLGDTYVINGVWPGNSGNPRSKMVSEKIRFTRKDDGNSIEIYDPTILSDGYFFRNYVIPVITSVMPGVEYPLGGNAIKVKYDDYKNLPKGFVSKSGPTDSYTKVIDLTYENTLSGEIERIPGDISINKSMISQTLRRILIDSCEDKDESKEFMRTEKLLTLLRVLQERMNAQGYKNLAILEKIFDLLKSYVNKRGKAIYHDRIIMSILARDMHNEFGAYCDVIIKELEKTNELNNEQKGFLDRMSSEKVMAEKAAGLIEIIDRLKTEDIGRLEEYVDNLQFIEKVTSPGAAGSPLMTKEEFLSKINLIQEKVLELFGVGNERYYYEGKVSGEDTYVISRVWRNSGMFLDMMEFRRIDGGNIIEIYAHHFAADLFRFYIIHAIKTILPGIEEPPIWQDGLAISIKYDDYKNLSPEIAPPRAAGSSLTLEEINKRIGELEGNIAERRNRITQIQDDISVNEKKIADIIVQFRSAANFQLYGLGKDKRELEEQNDRNYAAISRIHEHISEMSRELRKLREEAAKVAGSPLTVEQLYYKLLTTYENKEFFRDGEKAFIDLIDILSQVDKKAELGRKESELIDEIIRRIIERHEKALVAHLEPVFVGLYSEIYLKTANYGAEEPATIEEVLGVIERRLGKNQEQLKYGKVGNHLIPSDQQEGFLSLSNKFIAAVKNAQKRIVSQGDASALPLTLEEAARKLNSFFKEDNLYPGIISSTRDMAAYYAAAYGNLNPKDKDKILEAAKVAAGLLKEIGNPDAKEAKIYEELVVSLSDGFTDFLKHKEGSTVPSDSFSVRGQSEDPVMLEVGSSSLQTIQKPTNPLGGIDLTDRMLNMQIERMGSFASSSLVLPEITNLEALDLDEEYERIQTMVSSSIRPSDTRILEFAAACYYRGEFDSRLAQVSSCIKAAHLADEISGRDSSPALRLATMLPDALYGG